jgi:hypothetical protein
MFNFYQTAAGRRIPKKLFLSLLRLPFRHVRSLYNLGRHTGGR